LDCSNGAPPKMTNAIARKPPSLALNNVITPARAHSSSAAGGARQVRCASSPFAAAARSPATKSSLSATRWATAAAQSHDHAHQHRSLTIAQASALRNGSTACRP
jgi:hypothetical protein